MDECTKFLVCSVPMIYNDLSFSSKWNLNRVKYMDNTCFSEEQTLLCLLLNKIFIYLGGKYWENS